MDLIFERYDDIRDFTQSIALVPCSAKEGEGIQDLLAITVGLAERFLSTQLTDTLGPAEASVLELRDERELGKDCPCSSSPRRITCWRLHYPVHT